MGSTEQTLNEISTKIDFTDKISLDLKNLDLVNFDQIYTLIIKFTQQNTSLKNNVSGLNITSIDLSDNYMSCLF